jgi:hypothetical protein
MYIGEIHCTVEEHVKESKRDLKLIIRNVCAEAEYAVNKGHQTQFEATLALMKLPHHTSSYLRSHTDRLTPELL